MVNRREFLKTLAGLTAGIALPYQIITGRRRPTTEPF